MIAPLYKGTVADFLKLFSASICTNSVQTLTKNYKKEHGCQHDKEPSLSGNCHGEIEAAHIKGCERKDIMLYIIWCIINKSAINITDFLTKRPQSKLQESCIIEIDLFKFLEKFKQFHKDNIAALIIPLCHKHHKQYDK